MTLLKNIAGNQIGQIELVNLSGSEQLSPSLQIAILRTAPAGRDADWDDARIPNLIIRGARDYLPPAQPGADVSSLVPAHKP